MVIENVFVKEELRKKGIGKKLMKNLLREVLKRYFKKGVVYVMALTRKNNRGFINLMKKLGFTIGYKDWVWIEKEFTNEFPKR